MYDDEGYHIHPMGLLIMTMMRLMYMMIVMIMIQILALKQMTQIVMDLIQKVVMIMTKNCSLIL